MSMTFALPHWNKQLLSARRPRVSLCTSEIMTLLIHFHQSDYRNFKAYYLEHVMIRLRKEFPNLVSYNRFVELIPSVIVPLTLYLRHACLGACTGITFIDSTMLAVCKNPRIHYHKTFAGLARRGKTSTGWFYGFI
jgi:cellobiose-specific phosphotransferase system component IIC